jgi:hypothetical protein
VETVRRKRHRSRLHGYQRRFAGIVFAKVAACILIASCAIANALHRIQTDEGSLLPVLPEPPRFHSRSYRSRFAAVLVNNDRRLLASGSKTGLNEIDFGLYYGRIVLRAALQSEPGTECRHVGNAGDVEKDILWQHCSKTRENLLCTAPLPLKVNDIRLHKHRTAISEERHGSGGECQVGILFDL